MQESSQYIWQFKYYNIVFIGLLCDYILPADIVLSNFAYCCLQVRLLQFRLFVVRLGTRLFSVILSCLLYQQVIDKFDVAFVKFDKKPTHGSEQRKLLKEIALSAESQKQFIIGFVHVQGKIMTVCWRIFAPFSVLGCGVGNFEMNNVYPSSLMFSCLFIFDLSFLIYLYILIDHSAIWRGACQVWWNLPLWRCSRSI